MSEYHLYLIENDGHIREPAKVLDCEKDETAVDEAKKFLNDHDVEIWQGARMVAFVGSDTKATAKRAWFRGML